MRILLINKFHYRKAGAERAYFDTASILADNGHQIAFFSMQHPDNLPTPWSRFFVRQVDYVDAKQSLFSKILAAAHIIWNFEAARNLEQLIEEFSPEIAHLHNTYHQISPSILWVLKRHHIPIVMTLHDYKAVSPNYSLFVRGKIWEHVSGWRTIVDRAIKDSYLKSLVCACELWLHRCIQSYARVGQFMAPSQFLIHKYQELGFSYPIVHVPQPLAPFPQMPTTFGQGKYFFFAGRLSAEKGVPTLLEAAKDLPQEQFVIAGSGPEEPRLRAEYSQYPNITFLGHLTGEPLFERFRGAKALIIPSEWYENMPYSLLEALGYGIPVIGSRLGGITERIQQGKNGFLFEAGDAADLMRAIQSFNTCDHRVLGKQAWESVQDLQPVTYYQALMTIYLPLVDNVHH